MGDNYLNWSLDAILVHIVLKDRYVFDQTVYLVDYLGHE